MDCPQRQAAQQPAPTPGPQAGQGNKTAWNQVKGIHWFIEVLVVETQHVEWFYIISVAFSVTKIPIWLYTAIYLHCVLHCRLENTRRAGFLHCSKSDNISVIHTLIWASIMMLLFMHRVQWQPPTPPWRTHNLLQSSSPLRAPSLLRGVSRNFPPHLCRDWIANQVTGVWSKPHLLAPNHPVSLLGDLVSTRQYQPRNTDCGPAPILWHQLSRSSYHPPCVGSPAAAVSRSPFAYQNIMTMDGGNEGEKKKM